MNRSSEGDSSGLSNIVVKDSRDIFLYRELFQETVDFKLREKVLSNEKECFRKYERKADEFATCVNRWKKETKAQFKTAYFLNMFLKNKIQDCLEASPTLLLDCFVECRKLSNEIIRNIEKI